MRTTPSPLSRRSVLQGALALGGLGLISPALAACSSDTATTAQGAGSVGAGKTIGVSLNGLVEYTKYVTQGVAKAIEGTEYELKVVQANFDVQTELKNLESLVSQGVDGLVILPNTVDTVLTGVKQAKEAGIPSAVALWAAPGPLDQYVSGVSFVDSIGGGVMIGEWLKKNAKPGKVIVVQGVVGQGFSERIDQGLDQALAGTGFTVVVREQGYFDRAKAIGVVERALQAHPDTSVIVSYAAAMGDGIASYLKQQNITGITHVTSDADAEMLDWLGTPYLAATRYYSAAETGLLAAKTIRDVLEDGKPTFENKVFQEMMTPDNKDELLATSPLRYPEFDHVVKGLG
jgi:ribose transport system substrate-binding protein